MKARFEVSNSCPKCGGHEVDTPVAGDGSYRTDVMKCTGCGNPCFSCMVKFNEGSDIGYMVVTWEFE